MSARLLVADSGPLIALTRLNRLDLPSLYFDAVYVVPAVWEEVTRGPKIDEIACLNSALQSAAIQLARDQIETSDVLVSANLDRGEYDSLALALSLSAAVLMDEKIGRRTAHELGVPVLGTLGLLIRARQDGVISTLRIELETLQASGYYLSASLVEAVLLEIGE